MTFQAVSAQPGTGPLGRSALLRQATRDQVLTNHVIKNNTQRSWTRCLAACLNEDRCVSINYGGTGGICELNASHREAHPGDVVDKEGWRYGTQERSPVVELQKTVNNDYCSTDYCSTDYCSTNYCSTDYCSTDYCSTDYCSTDYCSTNYCRTDYCSTNYCSTDYCSTDYCSTDYCSTDYCSTDYCSTDYCSTDYCSTDYCSTNYCSTDYCSTDYCSTDYCSTNYCRTDYCRTDYCSTNYNRLKRFIWQFQPLDCWDIQINSPSSISGEYTLYPARRTGSLQVYCDMDSDEGGWTVFQRRVDNSQDFDLTWAEYKAGFGDLTRNFWLGNDALNELTSDRVYQLRIEMQSFSLVSMAVKYGHFRVDTESNLYRLDIGTFYGSYDAGDSLSPTNSQPFSTKDRDNDDDVRHCAQTYLGPWWYKACIFACLNCPYINTDYVPYVGQGVVWGAWLDLYHSMKFAEMKIRPVEAMKGKDCYDLLMMGHTTNGVYNINVDGRDQPLSVFCEMVNGGGGWTVFQRRVDGSQDFYLSWADYKAGFGNLTREFWLGNDDLHLLSNQRRYELIVIIRDWFNYVLYALYDEFSIADEGDLYRLSVGSYRGTAGNFCPVMFLGDSLTIHHGMAWSTHDRDNDLDSGRQCAQTTRGAWWYNACDMSNLNGVYVPYPGSVAITGQGVIWGTAGSQSNSFYQTEMKIRPAEVGF
ncbi:uncharacterized protein [Asterias amurensis]|uniref:uncharacterized protein n=1 Tax=Asterias amurensis TaxID=7602 RepID=UPI003AB7780F